MKKYTDLATMIADGIAGDLSEVSVNCVKIMKPEFVEYIMEKSLTYSFPVLDIYSNGRSMQGGFISAAFDNVFGILVYLETKKIEMASIDLSVNYHRPIFENDNLIITVYIKAKGKTIIHLIGEAYNNEGKLIASATTNIMLL